MTDQQINAAIAEACGWTDLFEHPEFGLMGVESETHGCRTGIEHYVGDLNAMHEAEKVLVNVTLQIAYTDILYDIECGNQERTGRWMPYSIPARQRAEAFLKTLDKWEEAK